MVYESLSVILQNKNIKMSIGYGMFSVNDINNNNLSDIQRYCFNSFSPAFEQNLGNQRNTNYVYNSIIPFGYTDLSTYTLNGINILQEYANSNSLHIITYTGISHIDWGVTWAIPKWFNTIYKNHTLTTTLLSNILDNHISTTVSQFYNNNGTAINKIVIMNELANLDGSFPIHNSLTGNGCIDISWKYPNPFIEYFGSNLVPFLFNTYHKYLHSSLQNANTLYYLDYGMEFNTVMLEGLVKNLVNLKNNGMYINGIGFQGHLNHIENITDNNLYTFEQNINYVKSNNFDCIITEFDMIRKLNDLSNFISEANIVQKVLHLSLNQGVSLFHNWNPKTIINDKTTHFFDWKLEPTPSYLKLVKFLKNYNTNDYNSKKSVFTYNISTHKYIYNGPTYSVDPYTYPIK